MLVPVLACLLMSTQYYGAAHTLLMSRREQAVDPLRQAPLRLYIVLVIIVFGVFVVSVLPLYILIFPFVMFSLSPF